MDDTKFGSRNDKGDWKPSSLWSYGPLFDFPIRPFKILKWVFSYPGYIFPWIFFYGLMGLIIFLFLTPNLDTTLNIDYKWPLFLLIRNFSIIFLWFGFLHLRLYIKKSQDNLYKYNSNFLEVKNKKFLFKNQVYDNMFWSLISGSMVITFYEVLTLWFYSNGYFTYLDWKNNAVYCIILLCILPLYKDAHFYFGHRLLHTPLFYKYAHFIHHKNINPGPWSGLAMHPFEQLIYFSFFIILFFIPSHPYHFYFLLGIYVLAPAVHGHSGYEKLMVNKKDGFGTGGYAHYLHHKYFECNYGDGNLPLDKWFGTHHDGSDRAQEKMIVRMKERQSNII